jgi:tRNA threonylcarbamoyladenosine modification (KEOPS) complex  Pcc1 subunit
MAPSLVQRNGQAHLLVDFKALDIIALRASVNTNLRLVSSAINALSATEKSFAKSDCSYGKPE